MFGFLRMAALAGAGLFGLSLPAAALQDSPLELTAEQAIADLDRLYSGLRAAEADLFAATPQPVFDATYSALRGRYTGPVRAAQLHRDFQLFAALARHSHTRIEGLNPGFVELMGRNGFVFPLRFSVDGETVVIAAAPAGSGVEPGDEIRSINGEPNAVWLDQLTRFVSAETPEFAYAQLTNGELYFAWLAYGEQEQFDVVVERNGELVEAVIDAIPISEYDDLDRLEPGFTLDGREARMLDASIAYLRPGNFSNIEAESPEEQYSPAALAAYLEFIDTAFEGFIEQGAEHLVLDLRDNSGGTNSFSDPVVAWFADEPFRFASDFRVRVSEETIASNRSRLDSLPENNQGISATFAELYASARLGEVISYDLPYAEPREGTRFEGEVHVLVNRYSL